MRIAFITPELQSLVRRTNLASVAESLAKAMHDARQDARLFVPWVKDVDTSVLGELAERATLRVRDGKLTQRFRVVEGKLGELSVYLYDNEPFFGSRHPYGDEEGPYPDNWRRYALFARAVLQSLEDLAFEPEVLHCMDWTAGLVPLFHRLEYLDRDRDHPATGAGTYFAIHNLAMQGVFEREILPHIGVPHRYFRYVEGIELEGKVNYMKAGVEFATIIGTHSPGHALKIQERDRGFKLEDSFRRRHKELIGIDNGIDYHTWDPENDPVLPANFGTKDKDLAGKRKCKAALQAVLKLDSGPRTPIVCFIGRWDADSGYDLIEEVLPQILERNVELIVMGAGRKESAQRLLTLEGAHIGRLRAVEGYNTHSAHMMMGGSDILLLPSHYQPSNPLFAIAMRYGVVPIIYARSGLEDTVVDFARDRRNGLGFHFQHYSGEGLLEGLHASIQTYRDAAKWKALSRRCLAQDFSWDATAVQYLKAYRRVTRRTKARQESPGRS
ncbi:MAG: glycogen/starch synthase [Planctomycetota bacterium]